MDDMDRDDLARAPAVRQVVQSPANTAAERYDCQSMHHGDHGERRLELPAEARSSQRLATLSPVRVKIRVTRGARSRR